VDRALAQLEDGRRDVAHLAGLEHGQVALAATTLRWVPERLHTFRARYPHVRLRLIQDADLAPARGCRLQTHLRVTVYLLKWDWSA
jgi:DNA-binding transcriptional LysR family regulator